MINDDDSISALAARIASRSPLKSFPEDYLEDAKDDLIEIPAGTEIMMFRQDENIVVSIDSVRLYFRTYDQAKYIYYSAKRGSRLVINPASVDIQKAVGAFEFHLDQTLRMIDEYSGKLKQSSLDMLKMQCSSLLGYHEIF